LETGPGLLGAVVDILAIKSTNQKDDRTLSKCGGGDDSLSEVEKPGRRVVALQHVNQVDVAIGHGKS
jgi:hypothetical protein